MKRGLILAISLAVLVLAVAPVCATNAELSQSPVVNLDSIYVDVVVLPNGRINVTYWITISVIEESLGGFDLSGIQETTIYDPDRAYAEVDGNRYNLVVGTLSNGYALDWTPRTQAGETVTVVFGYFSTNRVIEMTTGTFTLEGSGAEITGDLAVLNWAPVQWSVPVDYQNVRVIYPIEMQTSWITGEGGITPDGADYAGYVVDYRQGLEDNYGGLYPFDEDNLLAYPSSASASPRNFSVSLASSNLDSYDHFRVFQYTNWSFYAPYLEPGAVAYSVEENINADARVEFSFQVTVFNIGDAPLEDVTVTMSVPDNLTLTSGLVSTYIGSLDGGDLWYLTYSFIPDNIPEILP
ncbi:MAG: hypothetical protein ACFFD6_03620, partial [Candidatus Thorarchaeota archaeon]